MFREIKNPTFAIQTVGRILRMPFAKHFPHPELNIGYLYTNYKRNEVLAEYAKSKTENRPAINGSYRKKNIEPLKLGIGLYDARGLQRPRRFIPNHIQESGG